jgi:subtilase-type serine protease
MKKLFLVMLSAFMLNGFLYAQNAASFKTPEYNLQWALEQINAAQAYAAGFTGKNVVVTVLDSGINPSHPELAGKITNNSYDFLTGSSDLLDYSNHGTGVAGIIAARKDNNFMHGVAFDSKIAMFTMLYSGLASNSADSVKAFINAVGTKISNNSWGPSCVDEDGQLTGACFIGAPNQPISQSEINRTNIILKMIESERPGTYTNFKNAVGKDKIFVFAAGNDAQSQVDFQAALPLMPGYEALKDQWIIVVATNNNGDIASYSNVCGGAKDMCIAAPGGDVNFNANPPYADQSTLISVPDGSSPGLNTGAGTSFAAPLVSGTLALVQEAFPYMTAPQMVQTVFTTADQHKPNSYTIPVWYGELSDNPSNIAGQTYDYSDIFGHGMLNAGKAVLGPAAFDNTWSLNTMIFDSEFANDISGTGGLIKSGVSTLIMSGNNTYSGNTVINKGRLEINGSLMSNVTVNAEGNLGGSGSINSNVDNYGLISNGNLQNKQYTPYTLTINNLTNYSGGILGFSVSDGNPTAFSITDLNALSGSVLKPIALFVSAGQTYDIIDVSGTFIIADQNIFLDADWSALPFIDAVLTRNGDKIVMSVTRADYVQNTTSVSSLSQNAAQTLGAIDTIYMYSDSAVQDKLNKIYNMSDGEKNPLLESMGANQISSAQIVRNNVNILNQLVFQKMRARYESQTHGSENPQTDKPDVLWVHPFVSYNRQKTNSSLGTDGYDGLSEGVFFGIDSSKNETFYWGVSFGFGNTSFKQENFGTEKTAQDYRFGAYENAVFNDFIVRGSASIGVEKYNSSRRIALADVQANANYSGLSINGEWDVLYNHDGNAVIFPFVGIDLTHLRQNEYSETGAGLFNLNVEEKSLSLISFKAGIEGCLIRTPGFSLDAHTYYRRLLTKNEVKNEAHFAAFPYDINTYETVLDKDVLSAGMQMSLGFGENSKFYVNAMVEAGKNSLFATGSTGINVAFR